MAAPPAKKARKARTDEATFTVARVLVINTGGTIGMANRGHGYEPIPNFMEGHLRTLEQFHDTATYDAAVHGPGLLTGWLGLPCAGIGALARRWATVTATGRQRWAPSLAARPPAIPLPPSTRTTASRAGN